MQRERYTVVVAMLLVCVAGPGVAMVQTELFLADQRSAFEGAPTGITLPEGLSAIRSRPVALNPILKAEDGLTAGDRITLDLFFDAGYEAVVDRVHRNVNGTATVRARIDGYPFGYMLLVTTGDRSLGVIKIPERGQHFKVVGAPSGFDHYLMDIGGRVVIEDGPPLIPPPPRPEEARQIEDLQSRLSAKPQGPLDWATIDVMVVYTPAAASWAAVNDGGIANVIALSMATAQLALDNSETYMLVNLVYSAEVDYTESEGGYDSVTDLYRLTFFEGHEFDPDGYLDEVHDWRDGYGADLVALYSLAHDTGGFGWLLNIIGGLPIYGFSLSRVQQASWTYTHVHEMGHNMGCHHHKGQNVQPGPTEWWDWPENTWSAGWRWAGGDSNYYCSLMTYESGQYFSDGIDHTAVAHFSNPNVLHQGQPTGHAQDGDNARTLREIKHVVAAYETPVLGTVTITTTPEDAPWSIVGPSLDESGDGAMAFEDQPPGLYTVTWLALEGWNTPYPAQEQKELAPGGSATFTGVYLPTLFVSNVQVAEGLSPNTFDVTYDLQTVGGMPVTVWLLLSTDGGATFPDTCSSLTGDVGSGVLPGISRHIVWDVGADEPGLVSSTCRLRVLADDGMAPGAFVYIPPGTFTMGSPEDEPGRWGNEGPQHQVTLTKGFYMAQYEVTEEWWAEVMNEAPTTSQLPKNYVSWDMVIEFCNALSIKEGLTTAYTIHGPNGNVTWNQNANGYRLPTEAEWEYTCRATTTMAYQNNTNCLHSTTEANFRGDEYQLPGCPTGINRQLRIEVGGFPANQWGLYDMHGNMSEWVWCGSYRYYTTSAVVDPVYNVSPGADRVLRSGNYLVLARYCRSATRSCAPPADTLYGHSRGFRPVRTVF